MSNTFFGVSIPINKYLFKFSQKKPPKRAWEFCSVVFNFDFGHVYRILLTVILFSIFLRDCLKISNLLIYIFNINIRQQLRFSKSRRNWTKIIFVTFTKIKYRNYILYGVYGCVYIIVL